MKTIIYTMDHSSKYCFQERTFHSSYNSYEEALAYLRNKEKKNEIQYPIVWTICSEAEAKKIGILNLP